MIESNIERIKINKRLSTEEFANIMPNIPLDDLLLTEYRIDSEWNRLIQLKDSSKKLYQCNLCNVVQAGIKNLFAHVDGRKHKLKVKSIKQFYQPRYTYSKQNTVSSVKLNKNIMPGFQSAKSFRSHENPLQLNDNNYADVYTCIKTDRLYGNKAKKSSSEIRKDTDNKFELERTQIQHNDRNEPPPKKAKMVLNPAAINKRKIGEICKVLSPENKKPKYLSNVTIIPTINKNNLYTNLQSEPSDDQVFSTKWLMNNDVLGLVGVEYVVKIIRRPNDTEPKYECSLCEVVNNGLGMQDHLLGYNHRLKFCEKHFPTALRQYRQYVRNINSTDFYKVMTPILNKLAIAIEHHHGRDLPYECLENEFNTNRHEILSKVFSCRHASEQYGPTFTHIVNSKEVDKLIQEIDKYNPPNFPNSIAFDLHVNKPTYISPFNFNRKQNAHNTYAVSLNRTESPSWHPTLYHYDKRTMSEATNFNNEGVVDDYSYLANTINRTNQKLHEPLSSLLKNNIWEAYKNIVDQKVIDLNEAFQIYRTDPESHPAYNKEWQTFWKRRKNELIEVGLDHRTYNYQPEWVRFFNVRIEELYNQALKDIIINARERLGLPITSGNFLDDADVKSNTSFTVEKPLGNKFMLDIDDCVKKHQTDSAIRSLTTFERYLADLGPEIVELSSRALDVERNNPIELGKILTENNCGLLETAMKRFKGLVSADILDDAEQRSLQVAISGIETLLSRYMSIPHKPTTCVEGRETLLYHNKNILREPYLTPDSHEKNKQTDSILLQVDKGELAIKLAKCLAAQGKTDIDPTQLQKIISVYMMIEKKKNNNDT